MLPLFDKDDVLLYADDRVALVYDDEMVSGSVDYNHDQIPYIRFDKPTLNRRVTSVRILDAHLSKSLNLILVHRPDEVYQRLKEADVANEVFNDVAMCMSACDVKAPVQAEFLLEVDRVTDSKDGMMLQLNGKQDSYSSIGRSHVTLVSTERSVFDGLGPGDRVLVKITPVEFLPSQDPASHELSI